MAFQLAFRFHLFESIDDSAQGRNPSRRDKDELLSMTAVLEHLLESHEPIIKVNRCISTPRTLPSRLSFDAIF